jgi:hypothetical protein
MQLKKALFGALFFRVESIVYVNFLIMNLVRDDIFLTCSTECNRPQNRLTQGFAACLIPAADFLRRIAVLPITSNKRHYGHQRVLSSVGRAAPLQGVGREFEPLSTHQQVIAKI